MPHTIDGVHLHHRYSVSWLVDARGKLLWKATIRSAGGRTLRLEGETALAAPDAGSAEHAARRAVEAAIDQL